MSKIAKVVKRVPKNPFVLHDSLLRSSGWLQAKPTSEQAWPAAESSSKPSLNYLAMQHIFRTRNHLDFNADAVLQSVCHFAKQDTASSVLPQATSRGDVPARRGGTSLGGSHYPRLLFQDVNLQQYLSTIQPPRKNSTGLRPGRVIVHHYPKRTAVHVFTPDDVEPETWKQVATALSSQSNTSVFLKAVKLQSIYQSASLIAQDICLQLEQRKQFRAITQALFKKLKKVPYVEGIRVICSGRINGALIARSDRRGFGPLTLQSFSAQVDYAQAQAQLPYGILGIKVWVSYL